MSQTEIKKYVSEVIKSMILEAYSLEFCVRNNFSEKDADIEIEYLITNLVDTVENIWTKVLVIEG